jgi:hypothetical protein
VADDAWYISGYFNVPDDPESGGKEAALRALRKLTPKDVAPTLVKATASKTLRVRAWALQELLQEKGSADDPAVISVFIAALREKDEGNEAAHILHRGGQHIRTIAADGLRALKATSAANALADRVADDVWYHSGYANVLNDPEAGGKQAALRALRELASEKVPGALERAAKSSNAAVRAWAESERKKASEKE